MLITKASEYALLSLVLISKSKKPIDVYTLSKKLSISKSFLAKVLQSLAKSDILSSFKGVNGGFVLNKKTTDISIMDIILIVEKKHPFVFECSKDMEDCYDNKADTCLIWPIFNNLQNKIDDFLKKLSLADILEV